MPASPAAAAFAPPTAKPFGRLPDGREAHLYTLEVPGGWKATVTDYGAILTSFLVPPRDDAQGGPVDVVLGFDSLEGYLKGHPYFGAICGRCSNRIAAGTFELDGKAYTLATNNGPNHLHGGVVGFDKKLWKGTPRITPRGPCVAFEMVSPDGDEGYPGRVLAQASYTLTPVGELVVEMRATTDAPTIVNMVHHTYWNLAGHASGSIRDHELAVAADRYLPVDAGSIPTGTFAPVADTPFDFRPERKPWGRCGAAIETLPPDAAPGTPRGVDHNYVVRGWKPDGILRTAATLRDPASGRMLELLSDQPGVQVYMGNFLDGTLTGKAGAIYAPNGGICLETQKYPDSIHHADWPSVRLDPGQTATHTMVHRFTR
ncbi:MAG: galactose mutarotase [Planctomycetia bacterium]|nr:galactose mutarotase [Planctomycetia bacterium]